MKQKTKQELRNEIVTLTMRNKTLEIKGRKVKELEKEKMSLIKLCNQKFHEGLDRGKEIGYGEKVDELVASITTWKKRSLRATIAAYACLATLTVIICWSVI
jgi:hypothetical protein